MWTSFRPRVAHHADDLAAGGAAHDGVVDQHHPLALEQGADRIELELHSEVANTLARLDEGAPHIVIADQAEAKRNAAFGGIADGGRDAGIGHRDDDIGLDRRFPRQLPSQSLTARLHRTSEHHAVGPREVDVLENATDCGAAGKRKASDAFRVRR